MSFTEEEIEEFLKRPIHISKVVVDGVSRTKDDLIKDVFTQFFNIHTCEEYLKTAQDVQTLLNGLSVTKGVQVLLDDESDSTLSVKVNLTERSRWSGGIKGFLGNDQDATMGVGGGLNINGLFPNLFGRAEKVSCCWIKALTNHRKELVFTKPMQPHLSSFIGGSLFNYSGNVTLSGYKENNSGVSLDLTVPRGFFSHKVSWQGVWRRLLPFNNQTCFAVREQAGHSLKSSLKYELVYDDRDDFIMPSNGKLLRLSQELAGFGGDAKFYSKQLVVQLNKSLFNDDRVVVQLGANVGHIQPLNLFKNNSKGVSIMDKFYLGGPTSLRGFQNKGIGPRERDNALGADMFWQLSAHLRLSLPGVRGGILDKFKPQLFVNCGNATNYSTEEPLRDNLRRNINTMRVSYGAGIVTNFVGVKMELNYCVPFKFQVQDKIKHGLQFGVSVGD